jgi:hypothetical protein
MAVGAVLLSGGISAGQTIWQAIASDPGPAEVSWQTPELVMANAVLKVTFRIDSEGISLESVEDRFNGGEITFSPQQGCLVGMVQAQGGQTERLMIRPVGRPQIQALEPRKDARRLADQHAGKALIVPVALEGHKLQGELRIELRDSSHFVRMFLELKGPAAKLPLTDLEWWQLPAAHAETIGIVDGSPVFVGNLFFFWEHPMAQTVKEGEFLRHTVPVFPLPLERSEVMRSAAVGVVPAGQSRRGILSYLERERPRPYSPFVNYNSWWDISWGDRKMNEPQCLTVVQQFGENLVRKHGVHLDAFVWDDGWDDPRTLWQFHPGFPDGFSQIRKLAESYGCGTGVWLSPFGGYGEAKKQRLLYGKEQGFEINDRGFSLSGPRYFQRFREVCLRMIHECDCAYFKFDGIGEGSGVKGASRVFGPDIEALLYLTRQIREQKPAVFLSITTGSWPSPAWLLFGDSVWRGGHDWAAHGQGTVRQQWITYRDMEVYRRVVQRAPLYPINSLMTVTVCFGQLGTALQMGREPEDVIDEIWTAAGSGTQNFELYLTPQLMTDSLWQVLAEALRWLREHRDVLVDVHWWGGDPGQGQPYGYAAWNLRKGIVTLRNPAEASQTVKICLKDAWELPREFAHRRFKLQTRFASRPYKPPEIVSAEDTVELVLPAFTVLVIEGLPVND